jgi:hypothetical protein
MKLAVCFTVFNGLELLVKSIEKIYPFADEIILCYQNISNKGNVCTNVDRVVRTITGIDSKIHMVRFDPYLKISTKENERNKHQLMIDYAKDLKCTHFLMMATDHFYMPEEFEKAKRVCLEHDHDVTFTGMFTYYKYPTWQVTPVENYFMPFICKLTQDTQIKYVHSYPCKVDPSVQVLPCKNWRIFDQSNIMLHHYSMIRTDIRNKFENAAASIRWKQGDVERFIEEYENYDLRLNEGISYFGGRKVKIVENYFNM